MSTIQQLKNFIRHGKPRCSLQGRAVHGTWPFVWTDDSNVMATGTGKQARVVDDSARAKQDASPPKQQQPTKHAMAARATEPMLATTHQEPPQPPHADVTPKQHKRVPDENIAKLVAEENESKSKFPLYPGLERWELLEKMGDGAFSNVYRARDREGNTGEVAIKVVRKFEMNSMQVRWHMRGPVLFYTTPFFFPTCRSSLPFCRSSSLYQH
jgi:hypothetical protein